MELILSPCNLESTGCLFVNSWKDKDFVLLYFCASCWDKNRNIDDFKLRICIWRDQLVVVYHTLLKLRLNRVISIFFGPKYKRKIRQNDLAARQCRLHVAKVVKTYWETYCTPNYTNSIFIFLALSWNFIVIGLDNSMTIAMLNNRVVVTNRYSIAKQLCV